MNWKQLHAWNVDYQEAIRIQESLRKRLILKSLQKKISIVAGADVSYSKKTKKVYAAVLVFAYPELDLLESRSSKGNADYPYVPGLLTFREAPVLMKAFTRIQTVPDVVVFDGQGIAHPRSMGLAAHCGILLDLPSIGSAKSRLIGAYDTVGMKRGSYSLLREGSRVIGAVLRTKDNVNPLFVSPGHRMDLEKSVKVTLSLCRGYRLPEPVRQAHREVNRIRSQEI
jgi:deoxyribonuclease V